MANITAIADNAGKENLLGWPSSLILDLPTVGSLILDEKKELSLALLEM
jgi:hypothetical protein